MPRVIWVILVLATYIIMIPSTTFATLLFTGTDKWYGGDPARFLEQKASAEFVAGYMDSETDSVHFISQEKKGAEFVAFRYYLAPRFTAQYSKAFAFSIGTPFYEDDIWTWQLDSEEWRAQIEESGVTHVFLAELNDYFYDEFSGMFAPDVPILEQALYQVTVIDGQVWLELVAAM